MIQNLLILAFAIVLLAGCSVAQTQSTPSPSPTTIVRRPPLDQFGVSNGVTVNGASTPSTVEKKRVVRVAYVDQNTFDIVSQLIDKSAFLETELSRVLGENVDISPSSRFKKYFEHNIVGIMHVSEVQRTGKFGGEGIKNSELNKMLLQNEQTVADILDILNTSQEEYEQSNKLDKPSMLKAKMAQLNQTFSSVREQMAVKR